MKRVMDKVKPKDIGLKVGKVRTTRVVAVLFEVDRKDKADRLYCHLHEALDGLALVSRFARRTSTLVLKWLEKDQIKEDILATNPNLVEVSISVRNSAGGGRRAQFNVPIEIAAKLAERKSVKVG